MKFKEYSRDPGFGYRPVTPRRDTASMTRSLPKPEHPRDRRVAEDAQRLEPAPGAERVMRAVLSIRPLP
jgi:hypothetical protein